MVAAASPLPVIGVPVKSETRLMGGILCCRYSKCQWCSVATVALDGAENAGILAAQILATNDKNLQEKIRL
ncbi:MAG: hypothetical protein CM15mP59_3750 [Flavobacteriaceae bacterium]|nr:MAG: hypothetical protein CM15mP59_3750 [Flavobacteriaceae bacterium]